jgi:hypothetical protein
MMLWMMEIVNRTRWETRRDEIRTPGSRRPGPAGLRTDVLTYHETPEVSTISHLLWLADPPWQRIFLTPDFSRFYPSSAHFLY